MPGMANVTLSELIGVNRDELIGRCRTKVAQRSAPPATDAEIARGVPLFLDQLAADRGVRAFNEGAYGQELPPAASARIA